MSIDKGTRMHAARGKAQPTLEDQIAAKDYTAISKRGSMGTGALHSLAGKGDRDARAKLVEMREDLGTSDGDLS